MSGRPTGATRPRRRVTADAQRPRVRRGVGGPPSTTSRSAHLAIGEDLSARARRRRQARSGCRRDAGRRHLATRPDRPPPGPPHRIDLAASIPGRAYQLGEILPDRGRGRGPLLWVPMLDGTERLGVGVGSASGPTPSTTPTCVDASGRWRADGSRPGQQAAYSDRLRRWRSDGPLTPAWSCCGSCCRRAPWPPTRRRRPRPSNRARKSQATPSTTTSTATRRPRACSTPPATTSREHTTALAHHRDPQRPPRRRGRPRRDRRRGRPLSTPAGDRRQFVTAVLARLTPLPDARVPQRGHPPPMLFRAGTSSRELADPPRPPLGPDRRLTPADVAGAARTR